MLEEKEKRIYRRFDFDGDVVLKTTGQRQGLFCAQLDNLSIDGLGLHSKEKINLPQNQKVDFYLTNALLKKALSGNGQVRHISMVNKQGQDLVYVGIKFNKVKKNRVKGLIEKAYQIRRHHFLSRQHRKELFYIVKLLPLIFLAAWLVNIAITQINNSSYEDKKFIDKFKDGVLYFLHHEK